MINCCSIFIRPHERDRKAGESDEPILAVAGGRVRFCTDAERAALALTKAFDRLSERADQPPYPDGPAKG